MLLILGVLLSASVWASVSMPFYDYDYDYSYYDELDRTLSHAQQLSSFDQFGRALNLPSLNIFDPRTRGRSRFRSNIQYQPKFGPTFNKIVINKEGEEAAEVTAEGTMANKTKPRGGDDDDDDGGGPSATMTIRLKLEVAGTEVKAEAGDKEEAEKEEKPEVNE
ncbi:unnamed protein product [Cyprideis torosa]|uniref:Uncharacterized protein n=1 Tax=Cyprideis torosa TaxID=163714 RepID=A0A7R8ZQM7_9CRUS|nr:unnamed protein product [Cyprideis torosa]CAG0891047.1 unnamed protein product [Cyprideis torosa]